MLHLFDKSHGSRQISLWNYFDSTTQDSLMIGRYKSCQKEIKTKNWGLTGLRKHLKCKHPILFEEFLNKRENLRHLEDFEENCFSDLEEKRIVKENTNIKQEGTKMDKISLNQNGFLQATHNVFKDLLNDAHFTNVTLVTEGNRNITAHKVILSAFSPVLFLFLNHKKSQSYISGK